MPQERPNHYGHLIKDAPEYPVKTVHFPSVALARRQRQHALMFWAGVIGAGGFVSALIILVALAWGLLL